MKLLIAVLALCLFGCHHDGWHHSAIQNGNARYDMAKLTHPPTSITDGLEVELTRTGKEIHGYVNVHTFSFPSPDDNPQVTELTIATNCANKTFAIPLMQGGQRARLTDSCLEYLLQTLELKSSVTLQAGHFSETLDSSNFRRHFDALIREPSHIRPQNLISFEL